MLEYGQEKKGISWLFLVFSNTHLPIPLEGGRLFGDSLIHLGIRYEKCTYSSINTRH